MAEGGGERIRRFSFGPNIHRLRYVIMRLLVLTALLLGSGLVSKGRAQDHGATLAFVAEDEANRRYLRCLRYQEHAGDGPTSAREGLRPDPQPLPLIVGFGRVIEFCGRERAASISAIRNAILKRHPTWTSGMVVEGAENVLSRIESELFRKLISPVVTTHGPVEDN